MTFAEKISQGICLILFAIIVRYGVELEQNVRKK